MILKLTAYIIIPLYTLLFVGGTNWFTTNLSVIGSASRRQIAFFILGVLIGSYYHIVLGRLARLLPPHRLGKLIAHLALLLLLLAVATPYLPSRFPLEALLHTMFAFTASLLLLVSLYLTIWQLSRLSPAFKKRMRHYRRGLLIITMISGFLLLIAGMITTALELFFVITTTIMVQRLYHCCLHLLNPL